MIGMGNCQFCDMLDTYQKIWAFKKENPELYGEESDMEHDASVALVTWDWKKAHKRSASRTVSYRYRGLGYALNYCPECGRKIDLKRKRR